MGSNQVVLNVYDLVGQNSYTYWCGVGVFHTGVEVYGIEYAYGGHEYDVSGVFATNPREAPGAVLFRESIPMGATELTAQQVQAVVQSMGQQYKGNRYHLLQRNCNHFASDLSFQLTGRHAPFWINRLAGMAVMLHCLLPSSWVPPLDTPTIVPDIVPSGNAIGRFNRRAISSEHQNLLGPGPLSDEYEDAPSLAPPRTVMPTRA